MPILFAFMLLCALTGALWAADGQAGGEVKADVMYWDGEDLVVKEMTGHEQRLRVTPETKIVGVVSRLKTGDKIHATVTPDGKAQSITLQIPDSGAPAAAPPGR